MAIVRFFYADVSPASFSGKKLIKAFIEELFTEEKVLVDTLTYIFCSDQYLLDINKQYLHHDYFTDIITFELQEKGSPVMGEIYISVDRVRENALQLKQNRKTELMRVILHGALHLCGYGDKTKSEIITMRNKEDHYLRLFEKRL